MSHFLNGNQVCTRLRSRHVSTESFYSTSNTAFCGHPQGFAIVRSLKHRPWRASHERLVETDVFFSHILNPNQVVCSRLQSRHANAEFIVF